MKKTETSIDGAYVIQVKRFSDERGFFMESFNLKEFQYEIGGYKSVSYTHLRAHET